VKSIRLRDWEVRAIQSGATQIRRLVKAQPPEGDKIEVGTYWPTKIDRNGHQYPGEDTFGAYSDDGEWGEPSPFGKPGDVLIHKAAGLEIVTKAVRVERVQEISEADAVAMGVVGYRGDREKGCKCPTCAVEDFAVMWCETNGPDSWGRNDYVWVGKFERKAVG
jgi:hypothetical protein